MKLSSWRVALRIARRDALRAKGRSALVVAMVALPVLGVAGADVVFRSADLDPVEKVVRTMGQSAAELRILDRGAVVLQAPDPAEDFHLTDASETKKENGQPVYTPEQRLSLDTEPAELARRLLPGATLVPFREGPYVATSTAEGLSNVRITEADLADPVWRGRYEIVKGRAPSADHEVAASQEFLNTSGLRIGDRTAPRGLEATPFTITGVAEYPGDLRTAVLFARPGTVLDKLPSNGVRNGSSESEGVSHWLVELPTGAGVDWPKVMELNKYGFLASSRAVLLDPPARSEVPFYAYQDSQGGGGTRTAFFDRTAVVVLGTVVGMALLEIVLLAGPAFAVGARRSRRQLGLLAAGGGDRAQVRAVVLGGGVVLGLTGAVVGLAGGIGLVALLRTRAEEAAGQRFGHFDLQPLDLLGILLIGLVTGLLAAVVPAVQASRQDVVAALTGRDNLKPPSRKLALLGLLMLGGGSALALLGATGGFGSRSLAVLGGSAIAELGMVALTPYLVGLFGRIGRWLPLGPRLALRDSVRHRGRTAPAVAAVMAAVAGSVAVGVYVASSDEEHRREYVAAGPANAVILSSGWGAASDGSMLAQQRGAVQNSVPGLGARADVQRVNYLGDCRATGRSCGRVSVALPEERQCPIWGKGRRSLSPEEIERLGREDQRCKERGITRGNSFGAVQSGDATLLRNLYGVTDPAAGQAIAEGKAVVFDERYLKDGKVAVELTEPYPDGPMDADFEPAARTVTVDAVLVTGQPNVGGTAVVGAETVRRLGLTSTDAGSVWLPDTAPADAAEQRARAALAKLSDGIEFEVERGYQSPGDLISLGLTAFAGLVALGAAGIATGLAAADSQRDLTTLAAVGAAPRIRRTLSGFQCGVIAAMGALLGAAAGVVPAVALRKVEAAGASYPGMSLQEEAAKGIVVFPWLNIGVTVVVLPLLAVALAALLTRSRISLLRRSG
ncbi:FtsX-like permease family protein [Kitasatospora purpeofusca]|uniref:FtsX-like permease family protein n=1 Tax=Kitasatospora purpeofusca TaxID=67352 RepID=UPI002A5A9E41|nr:FtsX-like permease family protein [Kitasatospora purpeofusca]MDY0812115.1 FtsX-like permease family protein [Kitasatospora purpeofusca]